MEELTKIQLELKAPKNQYNSFGQYSYRSCEDILEALKPLLLKHECTLTITDKIKECGGLVYVEARATITKGVAKMETVKAQAGINPDRKGMDISQSFGSSSSYARKRALNGLFLIDDTKDADTKDNSTEPSKKVKEETFKNQSQPVKKKTIKKPFKEKEELTPDSPRWEGAINAIIAGETTIEIIKTQIILSKDSETKLVRETTK